MLRMSSGDRKKSSAVSIAAEWLGLTSWTHFGHDAAPSQRVPFLIHMRRGIKHGFSAVLFLVSLATLLHHCHWLEPLTAQSMRVVHRIEAGEPADWLARQRPEALAKVMDEWFGPLQDWDAIAPRWAMRRDAFQAPRKIAPPQVRILRFTPQGYREVFGGVSPISRAAMAIVLKAIADELGKASLPVRPVIGIDVDITATPPTRAVVPATCGSDHTPSAPAAVSQDDCAQDMLNALQLLSQHANVIAAAPSRERQGAHDDSAPQNASMERLCNAGVDFAMPVVFIEPGEPHYRFLRLRKDFPKDGKYDGVVFPSLGNLMAVEACRRTTACGDLDIRAIVASDAELGLCSYHRASPAVRESRRNEIENSVYRPDRDFNWSFLNLLRASVQWHDREVSTIEEMRSAIHEFTEGWKKLGSDAFRPMLIIAIDDGFSDKHYTVMDRTGPTDGDLLHAATALSMLQPLESHDRGTLWKGALYDLGLGLAYLSLWVFLTYWIKSMWSAGRPMLAGLVTMIAPGLIGMGLAMFSLLRSANLLHQDPPVWEDPVLILIGMTLHAYVTMWEVGDAAHEAAGGATLALATSAAHGPAPAGRHPNRSLMARSARVLAAIRRRIRPGLRGSRHRGRKAFRAAPVGPKTIPAGKPGWQTRSDLWLAQGIALGRLATIVFTLAFVVKLCFSPQH